MSEVQKTLKEARRKSRKTKTRKTI